jgi:uncharacterized protein (TIGR03067 family)
MARHARLIVIAASLFTTDSVQNETFNTQGDAVRQDLATLQGQWDIESLVTDGKERRQELINRVYLLIIEGNRFEFRVDVTTLDEGTFSLDPASSPKTMTLTATAGKNKGKTRAAIYQTKGDGRTLVICLADPDDKDRPEEFVSRPGSKHELATCHLWIAMD